MVRALVVSLFTSGLVVLALGAQGAQGAQGVGGSPAAADPVPMPAAFGTLVPAGRPVKVRVTPRKAIRVRVPDVGTITGPKGSVSKPGSIRVQPYRGTVAGVRTAGLGLDVVLRGTRLVKDLKLDQSVAAQPTGTVPVFAHRADDGTWELKPARLDSRGRMIVRTRTFSINLPAFFDAPSWIRSIGDWIAREAGGRTPPVTCPDPAPGWFSVSNRTVTTHACGQNNPAGSTERAELRIKNNRAAVQEVTLDGPRDFVYVQGQPDKLRAAIAALTGTDPDKTVFLSPGEDGYMTVGYNRPTGGDLDVTNTVETTYRSVLLNYAYIAIDLLTDDAGTDVKWLAAISLANDCLGVYDLKGLSVEDPLTAVRSTTFGDIFWCVLRAGGEELADSDKALGTALDLVDGNLPGYSTAQLTDKLTSIGGTLKRIGLFFKALNLLPILQQNLQGPVDALFQATTGGANTEIALSLAGTPTPTPAPTPAPAPGGGAPDSVTVTSDNRVTNGPTQMREDTPAYLSSVPQTFCRRNGCALPSTDFGSGTQLNATCTVFGARVTNGQDNSGIDDANPSLYSSTRWYGIRWADGRFGYVSEVWIAPRYRGGLGLSTC